MLAQINYFRIVDCFIRLNTNGKYCPESKKKKIKKKRVEGNINKQARTGEQKRVKERWCSELRRNRLLSSFGLFCLSCSTIDQTRMWIDYIVSATVIASWMNLIFDLNCYSCRRVFAAPFCSIVSFDSSWTALLSITEGINEEQAFSLRLVCRIMLWYNSFS